MRALRLALATVGLTLLGIAALVGVAISAGRLYARTPTGRALVASQVVGLLDRSLAGRFELGGVAVLQTGGVEVRDLRVFDPEERLVLAVDRAVVEVDVTRLGRRVIALGVELDGPSILVEEEEDGRISLARAFAPAEPAAPGAPEGGGLDFTVRVSRLALRGGAVWWRDRRGATRLELRDLAVDARGGYGPREADLDLALRAAMDLPVAAPVSLDVKATRWRDALALSVLRAALGTTAISAVGEADLGKHTGRLAVTRLAVDRGQARAFTPAAGAGSDLAARAYAESDGKLATAALGVSPAGGEGSMRAAMAIRLSDVRADRYAAGLDLSLQALDPSRLLEGLPGAALNLTVRGGASGAKLAEVTGRLEARLARSVVRGVGLGPGELRVQAERGTVELQALGLSGPGFTLDASGRWRRRGAIAGKLVLDAADLSQVSAAAARILGVPAVAAGGTLHLEGSVAGTEQAPELAASLASPSFSAAGVSARGLAASLRAAGPTSAPRGELELSIDSIHGRGEDAARLVVVKGSLADGEATLSGSASVPSLGTSSVVFAAHGRFGARNETFVLSDLGFGWPGVRWALAGPATARLAGPSVDRLELASGDQRLVLEGGISGKVLDARIAATRLDLARLPRGLLPAGTAGRVTLDARATGARSRPVAAVRFAVEDAQAAGLEGLRAGGEAGWDGPRRRARLAVELERKAGGRVEVTGEVPVPLAARASEPIALRVKAEALPLAEALIAAGLDLPLDGKVGIDARLEGTSAAPSFAGSATLDEGAWDDLFPVDLSVAAEAPGDRLRVKAGLVVDGRRALAADAEVPLDLADALARPADVAAGLLAAPLQAVAEVPGFDLAAVAGAVGVPRGVAGVVDGRAELGGTPAAPRGTVAVAVSRLALAGFRDLAGRVEARLLADRVDLAAGASIAGAELLRATGSIAAAAERLGAEGAVARTPVRLMAEVPRFDLARASSEALTLAGTVDGRLEAQGTLRAPEARVHLEGSDLAVEGRALGALAAEAHHAGGTTTAEVTLRPRSGGSLTASGTLVAPLGLGVETDLGAARLDARLVADALDLGFLPAVAPGFVRQAQGKLSGDVTVKGPLARPSPRGRLTVADSRVVVAEYGEWNRIALDVEVDDDAVELRKLEGHRGKGMVEARGSVRGLASREAAIEGSAICERLTLARAGMDIATLDLKVSATGTCRPSGVDLEVRVPGGTIGLPKRLPRTLQTLAVPQDIVVGRPPPERRRPPRRRTAPGEVAVEPFRLKLHAVVPGGLVVKGEDPRANVELKADVRYEASGAEQDTTGQVEVVRGFVEPIGGRVFTIARGQVQFTGGPPQAAMVDVEARWESSDKTKVTVGVTGPLLEPKVELTSDPALEDAQIALLIATGRTELKLGSGEVGALTTEQASYAAASAVVSTAFKGLLADKLPIDQISLDAGSVRAGTYLPDSKIYVGYVYNFEADIERGQNQNEVSVQYQITPRWTLESRYGDGQSGSASLIWSRDY